MVFKAEDGSAFTDSNSYITVAFADTHHADRNNTIWIDDIDPTEKQAVLIRATDYIDKRFGRKFRGERKTRGQALEWPRTSAFDDDGFIFPDLPLQLQKATAEYALRAFNVGVLSPDPLSPNPAQSMESPAVARSTDVIKGNVARKREKVGVLEEETWYASDNSTNLGASSKNVQSSIVNDLVIPEYPEADLWIEEMLLPGMSLRLARA